MNAPIRILVVLPYSGRAFGGGLAVLNERLTRALAGANDVRLLTMKISGKGALNEDDHSPAKILYLRHSEVDRMEDPGGAAGERDRDRLYELINSDEVILSNECIARITAEGWSPDVIIGHSRFSGPAAIKLKQTHFRDSIVQYFLHSYPVEGSILKGYEAYEERIDADLAGKKFLAEKEWMPHADIVMAMGPLLRAGATLILKGAGKHEPRIHECIPGVEFKEEPVGYSKPAGKVKLLLLGRASAPIKGFETILLAVLKLKDTQEVDFCIDVLYWDTKTYPATIEPPGTRNRHPERRVSTDEVQQWVDGLLNQPASDRIVRVLGKSNTPSEDIRSSHAVLMPSYIEHFGLVPFEATECGVPVLVNEISGAGMFLDRCGFGHCVVRDFDRSKARPLRPEDFLVDVARDAFDDGPDAWAGAIRDLVRTLPERFASAAKLRTLLQEYTYDDFARTVVNATATGWKNKITVQGPEGRVEEWQ